MHLLVDHAFGNELLHENGGIRVVLNVIRVLDDQGNAMVNVIEGQANLAMDRLPGTIADDLAEIARHGQNEQEKGENRIAEWMYSLGSTTIW